MSRRITILGAGESGMGAAKLAKSLGYDVFVSDSGSIKASTELEELGIEFEENGHSSRVLEATEIIKSPGIPPTVEVLAEAKSRGIAILDEIEFAGRYTSAKKIIITGTNGKTTTTRLIEHVLVACGYNAKAVGNIGNSFSYELLNGDRDVFVIECSSFQLDAMNSFRAEIGILLNISPDHLNRYGTMEAYASSKNHISDLLTEEGLFIFNADDSRIQQPSRPVMSKGFSLSKMSAAFKAGSSLVIDSGLEIDTLDLRLKGDHNRMNIMATVLAALQMKCEPVCIVEGLRTFKPVAHRLEYVETIQSVQFINDSKATNVDAVQYALGSFDNPLVWIAGGVDKGNDYPSLLPLVDGRVHSLVCLGVDNEALKAAFSGTVENLTETQSINEAVRSALDYANKNDTVLLSPACASFDLFTSYEDRGDKFKEAIKDLKLEIERGEHA